MTPTMVLLVGLPGAGKTTRARVLETGRPALRLTPDEWMAPLFGAGDVAGSRDVLEGRLLSVGFRVLELGVDVVVDFGLWGRDERSALRSVGTALGARVEVEFLDVPADVQWDRVHRRHRDDPAIEFAMTRDDLDGYRRRFEAPDAIELTGGPVPPPPAPDHDWAVWAVRRWPTLVLPGGDPVSAGGRTRPGR